MDSANKLTVTVSEAAAMLHVGPRTVYALLRSGKLDARKLPGRRLRWLIPRAAVMRYLGVE